jgi:hypothetical protein
MLLSDLVIEVRDETLTRIGQLLAEDLVGFNAVLRFNEVGTWSCQLPVGHRLAEVLKQPGSGIIVSTAQGTLISGPTKSVVTNQSQDDAVGTYEITGVDDSVILTERLAYPTPSTADVAAQTQESDVRDGNAEDVMKGYVSANIGPSAPAARRIATLTVETSESRGAAVTGTARFETLQELLAGLGAVSGLGFTIEQVEDELQFQVYEPTDRSLNVRLDLFNGRLTKTEYAYSQPKITRTIVGGQGDGVDRVFIEATSADSIEAEKAWGRRIEGFTDARSSATTEELQQAGDEALAKDGKSIVSVSISPTDDSTMLFGKDWNLGDKVSVVVGSMELVSVVTEVGLLIGADGVRIGATVGEPATLDYETQIITKQKIQAQRVSQLERRK